MLHLSSLLFRLAAPILFFTATAHGAVTYTQTIVYVGTIAPAGSGFFNSETAFMIGDTFQFSTTFDTSAVETSAQSIFWLRGLSNFSLVKISGPGEWLPNGTFDLPNLVSKFGTSGLTTYGSSNNQPTLTGTSSVFQTAEVNLAAGTIFRDLTSPGGLTLGERLGGPILPDLANSSVSLSFLTGEESTIKVMFQMVPEPSSALLLSVVGLLILRRKR